MASLRIINEVLDTKSDIVQAQARIPRPASQNWPDWLGPAKLTFLWY
jgi:hypothetical protein